MSDTTAPMDGSDDAVAAMILQTQEAEAPEVEADEAVVDEADAPEQAEDDAADDAEAYDDEAEVEEDNEGEEIDEDDGPAPELYTVKVDGVEKQVTLDDLKRDFSGQQYIQQKMQENAQFRKEVEQVYHQLQQEAQQVQALRHQLESGSIAKPTPPSDEMFQNDPIGYMEAKIKYDNDLAAWQEQAQSLEAMTERQRQMQAQAMQYQLREEAQKLAQAIPEFADPQKAAKLKEEISRTGTEYGYSPEELAQVTDARAVQVLHDAMRYRQMKAARKSAQSKAETARPVVKPGAKKTANQGKVAKRKQEAARMKKSGDIDSVANFLLS